MRLTRPRSLSSRVKERWTPAASTGRCRTSIMSWSRTTGPSSGGLTPPRASVLFGLPGARWSATRNPHDPQRPGVLECGGCEGVVRGPGGLEALQRWSSCRQLPGFESFDPTICQSLLSWTDHQGRQLFGSLVTYPSRQAGGPTPWSSRGLLPPYPSTKEFQRCRGGHRTQASHDWIS